MVGVNCTMLAIGGVQNESKRRQDLVAERYRHHSRLSDGELRRESAEFRDFSPPDGREFFFTRLIDDVFIMHRCLLGDEGGWSLASALAAPVNSFRRGDVFWVDAAAIEKMRP